MYFFHETLNMWIAYKVNNSQHKTFVVLLNLLVCILKDKKEAAEHDEGDDTDTYDMEYADMDFTQPLDAAPIPQMDVDPGNSFCNCKDCYPSIHFVCVFLR